MPDRFGLDFETYSAVSLPDHGLERYVSDPSFCPLIATTYMRDDFGNKTFLGEFDFILDRGAEHRFLTFIDDTPLSIVAHNAGFERRVLQQMGLPLPAHRFIDSAMVARAAGAAGKLEAAAPQLLDIDKMSSGWDLIKLFSIPSKEQLESGQRCFDTSLPLKHPAEWDEFMRYCMLDSRLGFDLVDKYGSYLSHREIVFAEITSDMNFTGWPVDVKSIEEMQRRYLENQVKALEEFRSTGYDGVADLNLNSHPQQQLWCADRGIKVKSFDKNHVESLIKRLDKKLATISMDSVQYQNYSQVLHLMRTKQILGGSSLKKLKVILDTHHEGRLYDQYLHVGAGQTWRTTGRSAQMQNLKRIGDSPDDMSELEDPDMEWDNDKLAENIRQGFVASHPDGRLIVGDFSSVESRGLGWLAGAKWKTEAFAEGKDLYKVLATKIYPGLAYDAVTKPQRQTGKVGELSCGYGAGPGAVISFAAGMGITMTEAEAAKLVNDWRAANPEIVLFWNVLDTMLHEVVEHGVAVTNWYLLPDRFKLRLRQIATPASLSKLHKTAQSIAVEVLDKKNRTFLVRYFHGCYMRGRDINYYKPTDRKTGDVWKRTYTNPKTKQREFYKLYGGKLAGILTQSFCRELFMQSLLSVYSWAERLPNVALIGQFHDEIVLDWWPHEGGVSLEYARVMLNLHMSNPGSVMSFPLAADIKDDYRYTK